MPRFSLFSGLPRLALTGLVLAWLCSAAPAWALEAGAAKVEITPPIGTPLHGYGDRMSRPSTSVHDPLWSRALFLDDGATAVMLVNTDLCLINPELRQRVLELAPSEVPKENIILTATHTHNAQGAMHRHLPMRFVAGQFMPEVLESTARAIVQSMQAAISAKRRAAIGYGSANQESLSVNRREPGGPIDPQIGVLRVDDADGNPIAVVCNFAAHPTSVPREDRFAISADYVGFYYDTLEELTGDDCVALFLNGAQGNQTIGSAGAAGGAWERTAAVGRRLAERVKEVAATIDCGQVTLRMASSEAILPPTLASNLLPATTILQTLEIDDLLLCFFPGEPVVEIGLELRKRALSRGYGAQWSVGLANDYALYFIPKEFYHQNTYEAGQNFYGPRIAEWLYREFSALMSKGEVEALRPDFPPAPAQPLFHGQQVVLSGGAWERGFRRGRLFAEPLRELFQLRVAEPVSSNRFLPPVGILAYIPPFIDPAPIALPMFAIGARPMLENMTDDTFTSLEGMAEGAGLPFDAVWLLQNAHHAAVREDKGALFTSPLCTIFGLAKERNSDGVARVARNLDWAGDETPVLFEVRPSQGRAYVHVGFPWNEGVFSGMNEAGLVVAVEGQPGAGDPAPTGPPIEIILREILHGYGRFEDALEVLRNARHIKGCHVFVAGTGTDGLSMAVVQFADTISIRTMNESGLLLSTSPAAPYLDEACRQRYGRVTQLIGDATLSIEETLGILTDQQSDGDAMAAIRNPLTRHSIVFEPERRRVVLAFPTADEETPQFEAMTLARSAANE